MEHTRSRRPFSLVGVSLLAVIVGGASALLGLCGPFTDVTADTFCPFVLEIYYLGITSGTSPTTFDPSSNVTRLQMAAFLSRTVDRTLQRGSRRAAMNQFWTPQFVQSLGVTTLPAGSGPGMAQFDGEDVWVANGSNSTVSRVHASDGRLLQTWTGASSASGLLVAMGRIFVSGSGLHKIDPTQPPGAVTTVVSSLGDGYSQWMAFDGARIWTTNAGYPSSVSIVTPGSAIPWTATTVTAGFWDPYGILFDGANVWVTDLPAHTLLKLDANAGILQTVTVGPGPGFPIFDGVNIWVPNGGESSVSVVRASSGVVLATLTGNGLSIPDAAAFDGQRILVTNNSGHSVSLWKAADLTALGSFPMGAGTYPLGPCSDGANFWIVLPYADKLVRF